jgi:serine/threonine protein kinase
MADPSTPSDPPPQLEVVRAAPGSPVHEVGANTDSQCASDVPTVSPAPAAPHDMFLGQVFGDFELVEQIGRGGMGVVYKAKQTSLDREVALKLLPADPTRSPAHLDRFLAEARAAASLSHPNIVTIYQLGECAAGHYFIMELIEGKTLEAILKERTVPISWAVSLLIAVAEAVHYAHTKGIIHRDLKPANIMFDSRRRPVVMDFGIAKFLHKSSSLTQEGVVVGTPAYMPPEQAGEDPSLVVGPHSDVYSLGAILYTLLAGRPPFCEATPLKTVLKVISDDPVPPVSNFRKDLPAKLEQICMTCLNKDPAGRYARVSLLTEELRRFRATLAGKSLSSFSMGATLPAVVLTIPKTGKRIRLFRSTTVIGRAEDCDISVRSAEVSKHHCRILLKRDTVVVEDLGSVNGILVNGESVERLRLQDGDQLDICGHLFRVQIARTGSG